MSRLQSIRIDSPGKFGLNDSSLGADDPRWLQDCNHVIFGSLGHIEGRRAIDEITTSGGHSQVVDSIHEYIKDATTTEIIHSANLKLYKGTITLTDITGTITTPTADDWQFVNFNGKCIAIQQSHTPAVYTGTGSFANITASSGTLPTGNCAASAFGRLWVADSDKTTVKFCATLDETDWGGAGAGSFDTLEVWPDGIDTVTAICEMQNRLLIFGTRSTLVYTGAEDPTAATFVLDDVIRQGTSHRDSVVTHANDVFFLNKSGLQSVRRATQFSNLPQASMSPHTSRLVHEHIRNTTTAPVKGAYLDDLNAVCFLVRNAGSSRRMILFDVEEPLPDGTLRMLEWSGLPALTPECILGPTDGVTLFGVTGGIAEYSVTAYTDAFDVNRPMKAQTAPFQMGASQVKALKEIGFEGVAGSDMTNLEIKAQADGKGQVSGTGFDVLAGANVKTTVSDGVTGVRYDLSFEATVDGSITLNAFIPRFKLARGTSYGD